jgi:hypothetical protein
LSVPDVLVSAPIVKMVSFLNFLLGGVVFAIGFGLLAAGVSVNAYFMRPLRRWRTNDLIDFGIVASSSE